MKKSQTILAWSKQPEPEGIIYGPEDLVNKQVVIDLFSFCQISAGYINADGWKYLFKTYGIEALLDLKIKSGWVNSFDKNTPISDLIYQAFIAGYNPLNQEKGDYDETIEVFLSLDGDKRKIDWREIDQMDKR